MVEIFSRGKVILFGEYAVMHGCDALCLPLKTGQKMIACHNSDNRIHWTWRYLDTILTEIILNPADLFTIECKTGDAQWVRKLILLIREKNPDFLLRGQTIEFTNFFPPQWGLGSSSATINSVCRYAGVNPWEINSILTGGSGADIAAASMKNWFLYRRNNSEPFIWQLPFSYSFTENTFFIYSGKKQPTAGHLDTIASHMPREGFSWAPVNKLVYNFISATATPRIMKIMEDHENLIAAAVNLEPIGNHFRDFPGKIKSLGAWGGDFFMAVCNQEESWVKRYFHHRGYDTVFKWKEFVEREQF